MTVSILGMDLGHLSQTVPSQHFQGRVASKAENIADIVMIAPSHQPPASKPAVPADRDPDLRPGRSDPGHQELEDRGCVVVLGGYGGGCGNSFPYQTLNYRDTPSWEVPVKYSG